MGKLWRVFETGLCVIDVVFEAVFVAERRNRSSVSHATLADHDVVYIADSFAFAFEVVFEGIEFVLVVIPVIVSVLQSPQNVAGFREIARVQFRKRLLLDARPVPSGPGLLISLIRRRRRFRITGIGGGVGSGGIG